MKKIIKLLITVSGFAIVALALSVTVFASTERSVNISTSITYTKPFINDDLFIIEKQPVDESTEETTTILTGLGDEVKEQTEIVIPDELGVTKIEEEVFQYNEVVESVTLPSGFDNTSQTTENVPTIIIFPLGSGGMFYGCTSLKEIVFSSINPPDIVNSSGVSINTSNSSGSGYEADPFGFAGSSLLQPILNDRNPYYADGTLKMYVPCEAYDEYCAKFYGYSHYSVGGETINLFHCINEKNNVLCEHTTDLVTYTITETDQRGIGAQTVTKAVLTDDSGNLFVRLTLTMVLSLRRNTSSSYAVLLVNDVEITTLTYQQVENGNNNVTKTAVYTIDTYEIINYDISITYIRVQ